MTEISAFEIHPNDNMLTRNIFVFLEQLFIENTQVLLKETNKIYTREQINELAEDIVKQHELANSLKEKGGEK